MTTDTLLRFGPARALDDADQILAATVLVVLTADRLVLAQDSKPTATVLLDRDVLGCDLDLGRLPRDRTVVVDTPEGRVRLLAEPGGCACSGGGSLLRGWQPPARVGA